MTSREFFVAVIANQINDEVVAFAQKQVAAMDKSNSAVRAKNAEKAAKRAADRAPILAAIMACITSEPKTATTLIEEAQVDIKPQLVPTLLKEAIAAGTVVKTDVKIKGKAAVRGYAKAE